MTSLKKEPTIYILNRCLPQSPPCSISTKWESNPLLYNKKLFDEIYKMDCSVSSN